MTIDRVISLQRTAGIEPVVVQQNDRQSRTVRFYVTQAGGSPLPLAGKTARVLFRKNGATSPAYQAQVGTDGWISLPVPDEVMANAGDGEMQLVLQQGESLLHGFTVPFRVLASLSFVGETESPADDPMAVNWKNLPGKPAAFPPAGHTHTPAEAGALPADATAADAALLGGLPPKHYRTPPSLLDNGWLVQPVNQRGSTAYTGAGYGIDRWLGMSRTGLQLTAEGAVLSNTNPAAGGCYWQQMLPPSVLTDENGDYTFAAEIDGTVVAVSGKLHSAAEVSFGNGSLAFLYSSVTGFHACRITLQAGFEGSVTVAWAALYPGAYTAAQLPPFRPEPDAEALARCRRCFCRHRAEAGAPLGFGMARSATAAWVLVPRGPMRLAAPTVTVSGAPVVLQGDGSAIPVAAAAVESISDDWLRLSLTAEGLTPGAPLVLQAGPEAAVWIDESADL